MNDKKGYKPKKGDRIRAIVEGTVITDEVCLCGCVTFVLDKEHLLEDPKFYRQTYHPHGEEVEFFGCCPENVTLLERKKEGEMNDKKKLIEGQKVKVEVEGTFKGYDEEGDAIVEAVWYLESSFNRYFNPQHITPILPNFEVGDLVKHEPTGVVMYFSSIAGSGRVRLATSMYSVRQGDFACSMPSNECSIVRKHNEDPDKG